MDIFLPVGSKLPFWGGDVLLQGNVELKPGGSASNTASHLAKLAETSVSSTSDNNASIAGQISVSLHTALGNDEWALVVEKHHARTGVQLVDKRTPGVGTGVCVVLSGKSDRAFMTQNGSMAALTSDMLDHTKLRQAQHLHIGGFFSVPKLQEGLAPLVCTLRETNPDLTVSLDTNFDASGDWGKTSSHLGKLLGEVDVFLPNETEAAAISGCEDIQEAAELLCKRLRKPNGIAIVTNGEHGCIVARQAEEGVVVTRVPAPKVETFVDATGAGDAFNAAFLHAWVQGASPEDAARQGVKGGCVAVAHSGACDTLLTRELLDSLQ